VLIFVGLVWALLGMEPSETYMRTRDNLGHKWAKIKAFSGDVFSTGESMKNVADYHLQQASDRLNGIDPYEKVNQKFSEDIKNM
jgi:hypothetical protein